MLMYRRKDAQHNLFDVPESALPCGMLADIQATADEEAAKFQRFPLCAYCDSTPKRRAYVMMHEDDTWGAAKAALCEELGVEGEGRAAGVRVSALDSGEARLAFSAC